jgi:hypothetical protein
MFEEFLMGFPFRFSGGLFYGFQLLHNAKIPITFVTPVKSLTEFLNSESNLKEKAKQISSA